MRDVGSHGAIRQRQAANGGFRRGLVETPRLNKKCFATGRAVFNRFLLSKNGGIVENRAIEARSTNDDEMP